MSQSSPSSYFKTLEKTKDHTRLDHDKIPRLEDITKSITGDLMKCPFKTRYAENFILTITSEHYSSKKSTTTSIRIPMIIHQTGETKCLPRDLYKTFGAWRNTAVENGYEIFFHDSISVNRLLNLDFPEFPLLRSILRQCINTFEGKVALWKYLVLYTYGGIFVPLGSSPESMRNFGGLTEEDGIFLIERDHHKSFMPDFMTVSPRHPLIYYAIHHYILGIFKASTTSIGATDMNLMYRNISLHAMNMALEDFTRDADGINSSAEYELGKRLVGTDGRTITLLDYSKDDNIIDTLKSEGGRYVPGTMPKNLHQVNWKGSCMSEIMSDVGG